MNRPYNAFKVFFDLRSDLDEGIMHATKKWLLIWVENAKRDGCTNMRQITRHIESKTSLDEARARSLILQLGIDLTK